MLKEKEKVTFKFENVEDAIKILRKVHESHDVLFSWLKPIIENIEWANYENQLNIKNFEEWGDFFKYEKIEKDVSAGANASTEHLFVDVKINAEELELELKINFNVEIINLIDAPFRHERNGVMNLSYILK